MLPLTSPVRDAWGLFANLPFLLAMFWLTRYACMQQVLSSCSTSGQTGDLKHQPGFGVQNTIEMAPALGAGGNLTHAVVFGRPDSVNAVAFVNVALCAVMASTPSTGILAVRSNGKTHSSKP